MSIVRVGLAETKNFADGYDAIFGKTAKTAPPGKKKKAKTPTAKSAAPKKKNAVKKK